MQCYHFTENFVVTDFVTVPLETLFTAKTVLYKFYFNQIYKTSEDGHLFALLLHSGVTQRMIFIINNVLSIYHVINYSNFSLDAIIYH